MERPGYFDEICANCGFTFGDHHASTSPWPYNYCPGHEGRMDWENNEKETCFKATGTYKKKEKMSVSGLVQHPEKKDVLLASDRAYKVMPDGSLRSMKMVKGKKRKRLT